MIACMMAKLFMFFFGSSQREPIYNTCSECCSGKESLHQCSSSLYALANIYRAEKRIGYVAGAYTRVRVVLPYNHNTNWWSWQTDYLHVWIVLIAVQSNLALSDSVAMVNLYNSCNYVFKIELPWRPSQPLIVDDYIIMVCVFLLA